MKIRNLFSSVMVAAFACTGVSAEDARTGIYSAGIVPIAPYTPGVLTDNGFLYISGQIPYVNGAIPDHANDGENDIQDQTAIVMGHLQSILTEAGYDFNDTVRATVYLSDISNYGGFNEVYGTFWGEGDMPPSRAANAVRDIPGGKPGAPVLVEVSMIAYKSE